MAKLLRRARDHGDKGRDDDASRLGVGPEFTTHLLRRAAASDCTLLVTGETGVGKGHLARWLHEHSRRSRGPFTPVNCGAIPESLLDSQLFGHARGAFSGAERDHPGLVRAAEGGTLLLDEVSELPRSAQRRLLRLLQEREVQPVGHSRPVVVDVRIIAATSVDLDALVEQGRIRQDLLFRLDVIRPHVRPLRERRAEIPALVERFNREFARLYEQRALRFTSGARRLLVHATWPGNVRQLRTVIERLHVLCPGERIDTGRLDRIGHVAGANARVKPADAGRDRLDRLRRQEVRRVVAETGGSVSRAATLLGVHRSTIYRWLRDRS